MHDLHAVDVSSRKFVECYDKLGIVIPYVKQIGDFAVRFFGQVPTNLHIYALVTPHRHKIYLLGFLLTDVYCVSTP